MASAGVRRPSRSARRTRLGLSFKEGVLGVDGQTRVRRLDVRRCSFVASSVPAVEVLYPDNKPMPYAKWAQLQDQRVRYFRTNTPTARMPPGSTPAPGPRRAPASTPAPSKNGAVSAP